MEVKGSNGRRESFRQLGSVSVLTVAIFPKYGRWKKWASKARKFAGFSGEKACSLKMPLPAAASEGSSTFSAIFFSLFLPLSMAESDEGKEVAVLVGLRGGILPCMLKSLGFLNFFYLELVPSSLHVQISNAGFVVSAPN
ncbi:hypothetical protein Pyn_26323 [Prunus yedoensis var. nudiflora]|uniref:Uncharacterized protein n=1 Tax=Prunus yedoensis var. nudiflora TaxID=2094558 RepID=A0A314ZR92_PRUYE|nr:hypothetical protein Pyn_26323 [Prunus yedoensis var. nudiflora]